ncbi:MAG: CinA family nicotinamide mononucleotide deamidase-related protein [Planctomycetaceae bacterium]|nr:CinA family nicotinamide mononucleotide deamidase-related protein [Planctomycetaceae bacterium]
MPAEIISIGSELTTGAKLDTNSQWLSLELSAVGVQVHYHTTVADDGDANVNVLKTAIERADLVLITGGLGPTLDDLTRDVLSQVLDVPLVLHEPSLHVIRGMFARRNREMPERNVVQAMFPEGSEPIPNARGTAPGIYVEVPRAGRTACQIAAMPGVPSEMRVMFQEAVLPRIAGRQSQGRVIRQARVNCFGLGESAAEELLGDVTARGRDPEVGITVHEATITLRIVAEGQSVAEVQRKIDATKRVICERMGDYAYGEEDDELEHVVVRSLCSAGLSLATSEAGTGGLVAHRLTDVKGHAECYRGGLVRPDIAQLAAPSGMAGEPLSGASRVSREMAEAMARHCRDQYGADLALAVTECSDTDDREGVTASPLVFIALADRHTVDCRELNVAGDPAILKSRVAKSALNLVRLKLLREQVVESARSR